MAKWKWTVTQGAEFVAGFKQAASETFASYFDGATEAAQDLFLSRKDDLAELEAEMKRWKLGKSSPLKYPKAFKKNETFPSNIRRVEIGHTCVGFFEVDEQSGCCDGVLVVQCMTKQKALDLLRVILIKYGKQG